MDRKDRKVLTKEKLKEYMKEIFFSSREKPRDIVLFSGCSTYGSVQIGPKGRWDQCESPDCHACRWREDILNKTLKEEASKFISYDKEFIKGTSDSNDANSGDSSGDAD